MSTLVKDKNFLVYTIDGKSYKFDINEGLMYGIKGNVIKSTPQGFVKKVEQVARGLRQTDGDVSANSNVIMALYGFHCNGTKYFEMARHKDKLSVCDKLDSIGFAFNDYWTVNSRYTDFNFINKNFKEFAKAFKEDDTLTIERFQQEYGSRLWQRKMGIKDDEHINPSIIHSVYENQRQFSVEEMKLIIYFLSRGMWEYIEENQQYQFYNRMEDMFKWAKMLDIKVEKSDFIKQFSAIKKTYETKKSMLDNKAIATHLERRAEWWNFENDDYIVVVPKSTKDFEYEAKIQHNCVFNMYLQRVINGSTNVVFIRRKDNVEIPYITCEVSNDGYICQFLLANNSRNLPMSAEIFKDLFATHIRNLINGGN